MKDLAGLRELFNHMCWADARIWQAVLGSPHAVTDSRMLYLLCHIHITQHTFLQLWNQEPLEYRQESDFKDAAAISQWGHDYQTKLQVFWDELDGAALKDLVILPWADHLEQRLGQARSNLTLAQTMLQVVHHSAHHRGQASIRFRELMGEPPVIDYIPWVWLGMPGAAWPSARSADR